jgi:hypothetical protein
VGIDRYRGALREVVGEALLSAGDLAKPKWERLFYQGLTQTFPAYGSLGTGDESDVTSTQSDG